MSESLKRQILSGVACRMCFEAGSEFRERTVLIESVSNHVDHGDVILSASFHEAKQHRKRRRAAEISKEVSLPNVLLKHSWPSPLQLRRRVGIRFFLVQISALGRLVEYIWGLFYEVLPTPLPQKPSLFPYFAIVKDFRDVYALGFVA